MRSRWLLFNNGTGVLASQLSVIYRQWGYFMNTVDQGFKKLDVNDKEMFAKYFEKMHGNWASSICFPSMLAWNSSIVIYHKLIDDYLCCIAHDIPASRWVLLPVIGHYETEALDRCMIKVMDIMEELKLPIIITDVSSWMLPYYMGLKSIKLKESYDESLSDYIYTADDFIKGFDRPDNRYNYNYFVRKFNPTMDYVKSSDVESYIEYIRTNWCNKHSCTGCQYGCMLDSASNLIGVIEKSGANGIVVYVEDKIAGYLIAGMERDQLVFHFKKTIHGLRGLNEYLHCRYFTLFGDRAKAINYTEDMNIPGLRSYKQRLALSYQLQHKYELTQIK